MVIVIIALIGWVIPAVLITNKAMNTAGLATPSLFFLIAVSWLIPLAGPVYAYTACTKQIRDNN